MLKLSWVEKILITEELKRAIKKQAEVNEHPEQYDTYSLVDFEESCEPSYFYYTEVRK